MGKKAKGRRMLSVRGIDPALWQTLRVQAVREQRSAGAVLADAITLYLKAKGGR